MICKFIGANGSLGLRRGEVYKLTPLIGSHPITVAISGIHGSTITRCPYGSFEKLFENWLICDPKVLSGWR